MPPKRPDLSAFEQFKGKKVPWDERVQLIKKVFPSTEKLDWKKLFRDDPALLGGIVNDIIKASQASPSRPGKRASVNSATTRSELRTLSGDDYSVEDFASTLRFLKGDRSIRATATKTGLDRNTIHRLLQGTMDPDAFLMESIATAFKKDPSFFVEYRVAWILNALGMQLENIPEASVHFYRKMRGIGKWNDGRT